MSKKDTINKLSIAIAILFVFLALLVFYLCKYSNMSWCTDLFTNFVFPIIGTVISGIILIVITKIKSIFSDFDNSIEYKEAKQLYDEGKHDIAFPKFKELAEKGYARAQFNLAKMYDKGQGIIRDEEKAFQWYRKAAEKGYFKAQNSLGILYKKRKDDDSAIKWYRKAAEQGDSGAQNNLGRMYENKKEYDEAVKWYRKAVEQGSAVGKNNLGGLYFEGLGVDKDLDEAKKLARESAEEGYSFAQYNLGTVFELNLKNYEEAFEWYRKAAEQGLGQAQYKIAMIYYTGRGIASKSFMKSYMWVSIALDNDYVGKKEKKKKEKKEEREELLQELVNKMTFAEITKAKEMAKRCIESGYKDCGEE